MTDFVRPAAATASDLQQQAKRAGLSDLTWPAPELVAMLAGAVTLLPGHRVFTGTPSGAGSLLAGDGLNGGMTGFAASSMTVFPGASD